MHWIYFSNASIAVYSLLFYSYTSLLDKKRIEKKCYWFRSAISHFSFDRKNVIFSALLQGVKAPGCLGSSSDLLPYLNNYFSHRESFDYHRLVREALGGSRCSLTILPTRANSYNARQAMMTCLAPCDHIRFRWWTALFLKIIKARVSVNLKELTGISRH